MKITTEMLVVEDYVARGFLPATLIPRSGSDMWLVREEPPDAPNTGVAWTIAKDGDKVRIPAFPFLTRNQDPASAVGLAFNVMGRMIIDAMPILKNKYEVVRMHTVIGHPVADLSSNGGPQVFRIWLGFGLQLVG